MVDDIRGVEVGQVELEPTAKRRGEQLLKSRERCERAEDGISHKGARMQIKNRAQPRIRRRRCRWQSRTNRLSAERSYGKGKKIFDRARHTQIALRHMLISGHKEA